MQRRDFLLGASAAGTLPFLARNSPAAPPEGGEPLPRFDPAHETVRGGMRFRKLGTTGEVVSCVGLGGHHIGRPDDEAEAVKLIRSALDAGINFLDNCWDYHDGLSELRMGKALQDGYRKKAFLMTKIDGRTKLAAGKQIDQCLLRLRTDVIDLVQHHEMLRMEDADRVFGEGALKKPWRRGGRPARSGSSASRGTRIRSCTCGRWRWRRSTASSSTRPRCR